MSEWANWVQKLNKEERKIKNEIVKIIDEYIGYDDDGENHWRDILADSDIEDMIKEIYNLIIKLINK